MLSGIRKPRRAAVFISGGGSTLQALLDMHHQFDIKLVISNRRNAAGVLKAKRFGKTVFYQTLKTSFSEIQNLLESFHVDQIILAGYMKLLPPDFVNEWSGRIMNVHPSLLPFYPGLDSAQRSYAAQENMGVSIHHVDPEIDAGQVFLQQVSSVPSLNLQLGESLQFLRRTEQHLLRELLIRWT